jgi:hypothetical protein
MTTYYLGTYLDSPENEKWKVHVVMFKGMLPMSSNNFENIAPSREGTLCKHVNHAKALLCGVTKY